MNGGRASHERFVEDARVELSLADGGRLALHAEERIDGGLCRADRAFDGEHHIVRQFAKLTRESQIS
jgi:hypothetical protein